MTPATIEHLDDHLLLDLIHDIVPAGERAAALEHLDQCPECGARLLQAAAPHERMRARIATGGAQSAAPPAASPAPLPLPRRPRHRGTAWLQLAASIAVVVGAFALLRSPGSGPASRKALPSLPVPDASVFTRDAAGPTPDSLVMRGLDAYARHDVTAARMLLAHSSTRGPLEQVRRVYLGHALLELGEADSAAAVLESVSLADVVEPWNSETRWALAQALAAQGRHAESDSVLRSLAAEPSPAGERARLATGKMR